MSGRAARSRKASFTVEEKLSFVDLFDYGLHHKPLLARIISSIPVKSISTLYKWKKAKTKLLRVKNKRFVRSNGCGRKPQFLSLENRLFETFLHWRGMGIGVDGPLLREEALRLNAESIAEGIEH